MDLYPCPHCGGEHPRSEHHCPETGQFVTPSITQIGRILGGKYELTKLLGEGGMGAVYAARHVEIHQQVAIKLLHPELALDRESRARLLREAMSAGEIGHENIVRMHDVGAEQDGCVWVVMEMLKGESLEDRMAREGVLGTEVAVDIMVQVLDALHASHEKGIFHRDIKPDNIFLCRLAGRDNFVKILDFGIAKVTDPADGESLTRTGDVLGTVRYMAPEQITGEKGLDRRVDIYSSGVVLYHMLAGRVPYDGSSIHAILYKLMNEDPVPLRQKRPDVPEAVARVTAKAMSRDRESRWPDARIMAMEILPFGSGRVAFGRQSLAPALEGGPAPAGPEGKGASLQGEAGATEAVEAMPAPPDRGAAPRATVEPEPWKMTALLSALPVLAIALPAIVVTIVLWATGNATTAAQGGSEEIAMGGQVLTVWDVRVTTDPDGAAIYLGGEARGNAPLTLKIPSGASAVTASKHGYGSATFMCRAGRKASNVCHVILDPVAPQQGEPAKEGQSSPAAPTGVQATQESKSSSGAGGAAASGETKQKAVKKCDPRVNPKCARLRPD